jgi:hypothetical protein
MTPLPPSRALGESPARWWGRHVGVNSHKENTLRHLVVAAAGNGVEEHTMSEAESDTPLVQTARIREKTFTRHRDDTLRSHPSCIGTKRIPTTDGAADVSGR